LPDGPQARNPVNSRAQKYFCFPETQIRRIVRASRLDAEGRIAIVTNVRRAAVDAKAPTDERRHADGEVVWSWRAHAGAKFSRKMMRENDGGKRWFTEESAK
jgi:hypothetical protein